MRGAQIRLLLTDGKYRGDLVMQAMDVMTSGVITVGENATVPEAGKLMATHGIGAVPVVDERLRHTLA
jgi:CBS domain-containing protein